MENINYITVEGRKCITYKTLTNLAGKDLFIPLIYLKNAASVILDKPNTLSCKGLFFVKSEEDILNNLFIEPNGIAYLTTVDVDYPKPVEVTDEFTRLLNKAVELHIRKITYIAALELLPATKEEFDFTLEMQGKMVGITADILSTFDKINDVMAEFDSRYLGLLTLPAIREFTPEEVAEIAMDCWEFEDFKGINFYNRERAFISLFHRETIEHIFWERDLEI